MLMVALLVMGPKELPHVLRKLGRWAGKLRRMAADLRAQSGIDDVLRAEGLGDDLAEIRKLARGELETVRREVNEARPLATGVDPPDVRSPLFDQFVAHEREYPREGADSYGALPEDAIVYVDGMAKSAYSRDALYVAGDANAVLPAEEANAAMAVMVGSSEHAGSQPDLSAEVLTAPQPHNTTDPREPLSEAQSRE